MSSSGSSEPQGPPQSLAGARQLLGVTDAAGFDEVLAARNKLLARYDGDQDKAMEVEAAYDLLFSQALRRRMTGEVEVSTKVRFADVPSNPREKRNAAARAEKGAQKVAIQLPVVGGLTVEKPQQALGTQQAAVFGVLATWALVQTMLESPDAQLAETSGLQAALAFGYSMYTFKENKKMPLGKAAGVTFGCLVVGTLLGSGLQSWVRPDIVPIGSFSSPGTFVTEFIIGFIALGAAFLV